MANDVFRPEDLDEKEIPVVEKIYFDMDGVLADFKRGLKELCGIDTPPQPQDVPEAEKEAAREANKEMWRRVKDVENFYDKLELMPHAKELFDAVYNKYGAKCEILSAPPKPDKGIVTAEEDKRNWIARLLSQDVKVNIVPRERKPEFCNGKGCILIDDMKQNILEWQEMGGSGFMNVDAEDTLQRLRKLGVID